MVEGLQAGDGLIERLDSEALVGEHGVSNRIVVIAVLTGDH
jgi:hypothetical protein